jgi:hypothetical protein
MSHGDDDAPERPASAKMPAAPPLPKPPVPGRPKPPPAPPPESNPFLAPPESSREIDAAWPEVAAVPEPAPIPPQATAQGTPQAAASAEPTSERAPEPTPAPSPSLPPPAKRSRGKVLAFGLLALLVLAGGGVAYRAQMMARSANVPPAPQSVEPIVEPPPPATVPPPPPTHMAESPPSASAEKKKPGAHGAGAGGGGATAAVSADPATQAILDATAIPRGHKIVVDGRVVGTAPRKVAVRCGAHRVQIGDQEPETIGFPCGGEVSFTE